MRYYNTCRVCSKCTYEKHRYGMVKFGPRHWAHADCGLQRYGVKFLDKLSPHQIASFPFMAAQDAGMLDDLVRLHKEKPCNCSEHRPGGTPEPKTWRTQMDAQQEVD